MQTLAEPRGSSVCSAQSRPDRPRLHNSLCHSTHRNSWRNPDDGFRAVLSASIFVSERQVFATTYQFAFGHLGLGRSLSSRRAASKPPAHPFPNRLRIENPLCQGFFVLQQQSLAFLPMKGLPVRYNGGFRAAIGKFHADVCGILTKFGSRYGCSHECEKMFMCR